MSFGELLQNSNLLIFSVRLFKRVRSTILLYALQQKSWSWKSKSVYTILESRCHGLHTSNLPLLLGEQFRLHLMTRKLPVGRPGLVAKCSGRLLSCPEAPHIQLHVFPSVLY